MPASDTSRVLVGVFGAAVGLKGEVRLKSYTGTPEAIASYGPLTDKRGRSYEITAVRPQKDMLVARVKGIADRNAAEALVNIELFLDRSVFGEPEGEDEFYHADLIGLDAVTADGAPVGRIVALHDFGAGDIVEISPPGGRTTVYLPFTRAVFPTIDIARRLVVVEPPAETDTGEPHDDDR